MNRIPQGSNPAHEASGSLSTESSLRVAIVGAGLMGQWHAYYAERHGATVTAVVDSIPEAATSLARRVGNTATFREIGTMLQTARPEVVHICSPLPTHMPLAMQAVEAGAHTLVEKPLTPTTGQAYALLHAAEQKGMLVCPVHQFAFQQGVIRAAGALEQLGDALHANFTICSAGGGVATGGALDAIVADIIPHPLSVLQALWPRNRLLAQHWTSRSARSGELYAQGHSGSVPVNLFISMGARPTRCELEILCTGGSVHLDFFHGYMVAYRGRPSRSDKIARPFLAAGATFAAAAANLAGRTLRRELAYPGLRALIGAFYAAANGAGRNPISAPDIVAVAAVRDHLIQQAIPRALPELGAAQESVRPR